MCILFAVIKDCSCRLDPRCNWKPWQAERDSQSSSKHKLDATTLPTECASAAVMILEHYGLISYPPVKLSNNSNSLHQLQNVSGDFPSINYFEMCGVEVLQTLRRVNGNFQQVQMAFTYWVLYPLDSRFAFMCYTALNLVKLEIDRMAIDDTYGIHFVRSILKMNFTNMFTYIYIYSTSI